MALPTVQTAPMKLHFNVSHFSVQIRNFVVFMVLVSTKQLNGNQVQSGI